MDARGLGKAIKPRPVIVGLDPAIHAADKSAWTTGSSPVVTRWISATVRRLAGGLRRLGTCPRRGDETCAFGGIRKQPRRNENRVLARLEKHSPTMVLDGFYGTPRKLHLNGVEP
jgi:hypothetical protein